jgi:hypothetical protein
MSIILISSEFEKHSAAESVLNLFLLNNKVDKIIISGKTKSSFDKKEILNKLFRYLFLFGPLFNPGLLIKIFKKVKSKDTIILDSSHYNHLIPLLRIFYPNVGIKILYHNNEFIFLQSAIKYFLKIGDFKSLLMSIIKLPYTLLIRILESSTKVTIIFISSNDIKYASLSNDIEFFDLTPDIDFINEEIHTSAEFEEEYYFIGNNFFNNKIQVNEFKLYFPTKSLSIFGSLKIQDLKKITLLGTYETEDSLPKNKIFFLGSNPTGFPIKSLTYLRLPGSKIHTKEWLSLNLLVQPKVLFLDKI